MVTLCLLYFFFSQVFLAEAFSLSTEPFKRTTLSATVPSLREQPGAEGCPLDLPEKLFTGISAACGNGSHPDRTRCCPVLAAWLYAANARTALARTVRQSVSGSEDMPDDSEACVDNLQRALKRRGIEIKQPNATCDAYFCYCGIRLHKPTECPEVFSVSDDGNLEAGPQAAGLEKDCASYNVSGCSKCLQRLYKLNGDDDEEEEEEEEEGGKVGSWRRPIRECEMVGLEWLLAGNATKYVPTVAAALRAFMNDRRDYDEGRGPQTCILDRDDGMRRAVDSAALAPSDSLHRPTTAVLAPSEALLRPAPAELAPSDALRRPTRAACQSFAFLCSFNFLFFWFILF